MQPVTFNPYTDKRPTADISKGTCVRVPRGTEVRSSHPSRKRYATTRAQVVRVDHTLTGRFVSVGEALNEHREGLIAKGFDLSTLEAWNCLPSGKKRSGGSAVVRGLLATETLSQSRSHRSRCSMWYSTPAIVTTNRVSAAPTRAVPKPGGPRGSLVF